MGSEELEDVILLLCDDNYGNLRTLPTKEMRTHKGGYGMYYHLDYHGWPISYEWINSSYLPKIWEQMTTAYEFGVRELWIVNVGDIATQEFPTVVFFWIWHMILDVREVVPSIRPQSIPDSGRGSSLEALRRNTGTDCGRSAGIYQIDTKEKT